MPESLRSVSKGDPIPLDAGTWNAMIAAGRAVTRAGGGGASPFNLAIDPSLTVLVRNDTGGDLDFGAVVKLGEPLQSADDEPVEVQRRPLFPGTAPAAASDPFAVLLEPVAEDEVGRAVVSGVAVCDVAVSDGSHGYAAPGSAGGTDALESAAGGPAKVVHKYGSSGTVRAVVLLQGSGGGASDSTSAAASAWLADLADTDCIRATVAGTPGGACSGVSATQDIVLSFSEEASRWESAADAFASTGTSATAQVVFIPGTPTPTASIGDTQGVYLGTDGTGGFLFAFAGAELCGGTRGTCNNGFVVRFGCICCPVAGWEGPGWYCVRAAGTEDGCAAAELLAGDECDHAVEICSGPYPDEASAVAVCGSGPPEPGSSCAAVVAAGSPLELGRTYEYTVPSDRPPHGGTQNCESNYFLLPTIPGHTYTVTFGGLGYGTIPCDGYFEVLDIDPSRPDPCAATGLLNSASNRYPNSYYVTLTFTAVHTQTVCQFTGTVGQTFSIRVDP